MSLEECRNLLADLPILAFTDGYDSATVVFRTADDRRNYLDALTAVIEARAASVPAAEPGGEG